MSYWHSRGRLRRRDKAAIVAAAGVLVAGVLSAFVSQGVADAAKPSHRVWLDPHKPIHARVRALLGAMTLAQKVGQMDQQLVDNLTGPSGACGSQGRATLSKGCKETRLDGKETRPLRSGGP